jgi:pimeloyl-ACP methyl ester carboxylesterase
VKDKKPLLLTLAAAGLAGAVSLHAQREADKRLSGLKARSCIADTARGPVEYSLAGSGPAVLILVQTFFPATPRRRGLRNDHRQLLALSTLPLRAVRTPTLILHSQNDLVVSFERVQQAAEMMPGASLMATEDGNHAFFITHYDQIWSAAAQFLRDHL